MFTLQQAIELATKAHEGQWRKISPITIEEFNQITPSTRRSPTSQKHIILDNSVNVFIEHIHVSGNISAKGATVRRPYISHPLAVMNLMTTEEEKIVAVLHDVIEDAEWQLSEIISDEGNFYSIFYQPTTDNGVFEQECYDISKDIYKALDALTKLPNQSYADYLKGITSSKLATKIKLADMFHNMSDNPSEHAKQKYLKALPILLQNL